MRPIALLVVVVVAASPALAQSSSSSSSLAPPKPVIINIDEDVIEASPAKPAELPVVIAAPKPKKHKSLIRLRSDFSAQVLASASRL